MIRLRTRDGKLPYWARCANQFALAFLLAAACRALLPTVCVTLSVALDNSACCAKSHGRLAVGHPAAKLQDDGQYGDSGHESSAPEAPCAFCALIRGMVETLEYASPPVLAHVAAAPLPGPCSAPRNAFIDRANPLRAPPACLVA